LIKLTQSLDALRSLVDNSALDADLSGRLIRGAELRALNWDTEVGADELADLLLTPGYFPNLKELSVKCSHETCFDVSTTTLSDNFQLELRLLSVHPGPRPREAELHFVILCGW
jgi:hypothetical protein